MYVFASFNQKKLVKDSTAAMAGIICRFYERLSSYILHNDAFRVGNNLITQAQAHTHNGMLGQ